MSNPDTVTPFTARQFVGSDRACAESSPAGAEAFAPRPVRLTVNGYECIAIVEPRTTLLETLREVRSPTGTKIATRSAAFAAMRSIPQWNKSYRFVASAAALGNG
jgi:hypothetical protein